MEAIIHAQEIAERNARAAAYSAKCERKRARSRRHHREIAKQVGEVVMGIVWLLSTIACGYMLVIMA